MTLHDGRIERRTAQFDFQDFPELETLVANLAWVAKRRSGEL